MRTITLTDAQREDVLDALRDWRNEEKIKCEVSIDGFIIKIHGDLFIDGYQENEYYDGTGAYVETSREANLKIFCYTEDGERAYVDDETEIACIELLEEL